MARFSALLQSLAIAGAAAAFLVSTPLVAEEFSPSQKSEIETIIKNYILKNPEILRDAIDELESREKAAEADARSKILSNSEGPLYTSPHEAVVGNPHGKITLVEFFDYNCGYCKKMLPDIARLIKDNPDLRVILRDFPILSDASVDAATIAAGCAQSVQRREVLGISPAASRLARPGRQGAGGRGRPKRSAPTCPSSPRTRTAPSAKDGPGGIRSARPRLPCNGTPSYVVGDEVVVGAVGYDELQTKLDNVRKCGKAVCS